MACPRCRALPVVEDDRGVVTVPLPGLVEQTDPSDDPELELGDGGFIVPRGYDKPRICSFCSGVYCPREM